MLTYQYHYFPPRQFSQISTCLSSSLLNFFNNHPKLNIFKTRCLVFPLNCPSAFPASVNGHFILLVARPKTLKLHLMTPFLQCPQRVHPEILQLYLQNRSGSDHSHHYHCCHPRPRPDPPPASDGLLASVLVATQWLLKTEARLSLLKL